MKKGLVTLFILLSILTSIQSQVYSLAVQGSSTANGVGAVSATRWMGIPDSAWICIVNREWKSRGLIDTTQKIAASTIDIYQGMWTGYNPPEERNEPNISYNCSRVMQCRPTPQIVIIAYPSTSYDIMSIKEVIERFQDLKNWYNARNVRCYILSTQPRDNFSDLDRYKLKLIRDTMMQVFGQYAIDVYTEIADPVTYKRKARYAMPNDPIHLNNAGHRFIAQQILSSSIFPINHPLPLSFTNVKTKKLNPNEYRIDFEVEDIEPTDVVYAAFSLDGGKTYYRVKAIAIIPNKKYYAIIKVK